MFDDYKTRLLTFLSVVALVFTLGLASVSPAYAQVDPATEAADTASDVVEEDDEGFDWGLLGLLGLLGLGGLLKRDKDTHTVARVDRTVDPGVDVTRR